MAGQTILVTGANRGLGLEFVKQVVKQAPKAVFATCRNPDGAEELNSLVKSNPNVHVIKLDVTNYESFDKVMGEVSNAIGNQGLNLLINNAGIFVRARLESVTANDMLKNYEVNTVSPLLLSRSFLPLLRQSSSNGSRTVIVNISSELGSIEGNKSGGNYPYKCSKAALNMVSKGLSVDLMKDKISCIALHPGWVQTDMGGPKAHLTVQQSVSNMINTIQNFPPEDNGKMLSYDGKVLPW